MIWETYDLIKKSLIWRVPYNIYIQNMQKKKRFFQTAKVDDPLNL